MAFTGVAGGRARNVRVGAGASTARFAGVLVAGSDLDGAPSTASDAAGRKLSWRSSTRCCSRECRSGGPDSALTITGSVARGGSGVTGRMSLDGIIKKGAPRATALQGRQRDHHLGAAGTA